MKILFIVPSLAIGGQEKIGMMLTNELLKYHDVLTVCFEPKNEKDYNYHSPVERIEIKLAKTNAGRILVLLKRIKRLRKLKNQYKPDVSIAFGETAILANAFTFTREMKIASIHQSLSKQNIFKPIYKISYKLHDKIAPVSNDINIELKRIFNIDNKLFINNGYDLEEVYEASKKDIPDAITTFFNGKVMSHMGRYDIPKCHWQLVKIFVLARFKMPGLKLLLIGGYDANNPQNVDIFNFCINYLQSNNCTIAQMENSSKEGIAQCDVLITGHQSNPHQYLSKANLFTFPSAWEGFPNAIIEAMACSLPIISADCPTGPKEILVNQQTNEKYGILLPVFDHQFNSKDTSTNELHEIWANTILDLLSDNQKINLYKNQSIKRAKDFSIEKSCEKWLEVIQQNQI